MPNQRERLGPIAEIMPGDWIKFRAVTRWADRLVWRKVRNLDSLGRPRVAYGGWQDFAVAFNEIKEIRK